MVKTFACLSLLILASACAGPCCHKGHCPDGAKHSYEGKHDAEYHNKYGY